MAPCYSIDREDMGHFKYFDTEAQRGERGAGGGGPRPRPGGGGPRRRRALMRLQGETVSMRKCKGIVLQRRKRRVKVGGILL